MPNETRTYELGPAKETKQDENAHISSSLQADTLFTFVSDLDYLIPYIKDACVYPRYCDENIEYLDIEGMKKIYIPMKCFCDINLHRIDCHLDWYGYYGLAFPKEWGMKNGIQPIQYINPESKLCKDFSAAFNHAINAESSKTGDLTNQLKSFMLHELMFYKPYEGYMKKRGSGKTEKKCFTDECEWRFIPYLSDTEYQQVYYDPIMMNPDVMNDLSNSLARVPNISLKFDYSDLKYIIIKTTEDFIKLVSIIDNLMTDENKPIDKNIRNELISKIIIWDKSKGDF